MENENIEILKELLATGVISQSEYDKKLEQLRGKEADVQKSVDQLKKLYEAGVFTKEEYEAKVSELTPKKEEPATPKKKPDTVKRTYMGFLILVAAILVYAISANYEWPDNTQDDTSANSEQTYEEEAEDPYANLVEKEMPENEYTFTNDFGDDRPSQIVVENPTDYAYAMKFVDSSGYTVFYFFVRPQSTATMDMGLGTYYLKWAAGKTWYGLGDLFGPDTVYQKDSESWRFESGKYWTIKMQPITNGNVHSESIDADEF